MTNKSQQELMNGSKWCLVWR